MTPIPVLPSGDLDHSEAFYSRLGFHVASRYPDYLILAREGNELHLSAMPAIPSQNPAGLYIRVMGIDEWADSFGQRAENKPWGQREFAISDPDENLLRFGEPISD